MAGLPLFMFVIFPAALAMSIRYVARLWGKTLSFLPLFLSLAAISFVLSVGYVVYHYGLS
ncbi:hypothetical protein SOASR030_02910 [Leminorella grimontii]|uniref:DUF1656 domain-containing protein n=1 Tax=Leminorella grimontii TaxID=82981 RepID=A0AAV5MZG2_9GAMM|nr:hypothetical protein [Leminorella grimontii]KFC95641.1 hypothetical protein GLGR_1803 [Leminorella grimontii ATCC 33999 = DSM 5078]GKX54179.1 hypothetical protein SOASR030_02910 [Leminorella grimontii]GKX60580.1 hypothetical protein SOASR031_28950 [Leminorella grimontii]VFS59843.1 Uncharacterised protein [Leminorella grimontii]